MVPDNGGNWKKFARLKRPSVKSVRRRARKIESATLRHGHRFIISRWQNLRDVRRHAFGWVILASLLVVAAGLQLYWVQSKYSQAAPVPGGTYAEGVIGRLDTINPIYASTQSERSAVKLIFSGLLRYDDRNNLVGDIADEWTVSDDGKTYTLRLRDDIRWHDGEELTADDVVYTLNLIKNPQTRSPLYRTWQDIKVERISDNAVTFTLPSPYSPFLHALTFGVMPEHVLKDVAPNRLRESSFNRSPVGTGPFVFRTIQVIDPAVDRVVLQLDRNDNYHDGRAKLERFQIHTYRNSAALRQGFLTREINAANDLTRRDATTILEQQPTSIVDDAPIMNGVYAFLNNDSPVFSDIKVRQALLYATDRRDLRQQIGYGAPLSGPLLTSNFSGDAGDVQASFDEERAKQLLDESGWKIEQGTVRQKDGVKLELRLIVPEDGEFPRVAQQLSKQWRAIGVDARIQRVEVAAFEQNVIKARDYDVLIYELAIGADPDVFAYWHSSQASALGFNLSNYKSGVVDDALVSARARSEDDLRDTKYRAFVKRWVADVPAIALYQPRLKYVTNDQTRAISPNETIVDSVDRYHSILNWTVRIGERYKTP